MHTMKRLLGHLSTIAAFGLASVASAQTPIGTLALVPFETAPFPYDGVSLDTGRPFFDVTSNGVRGHRSIRGGVYWEQETYRDNRSLLFAPVGFDPNEPAAIVVFFHGNEATLERDVANRQDVPGQLARSGLNAVLVAPQFAVDALDSSAGHFWEQGAFAAYVGEAGDHLADLLGDRRLANRFDRLPVILVAYSGGYYPAAFATAVGGSRRICGIILLDALFGEEDYFAGWIAQRGAGFFYSAYTIQSQYWNENLQRMLTGAGVGYSVSTETPLGDGQVIFRPVPRTVDHYAFVTEAWTHDPLQELLSQIASSGACLG